MEEAIVAVIGTGMVMGTAKRTGTYHHLPKLMMRVRVGYECEKDTMGFEFWNDDYYTGGCFGRRYLMSQCFYVLCNRCQYFLRGLYIL
jgi:hypothetical protein